MNIELKNGKTQNTTFIADVQQLKNEVYIILTNGTKYLESKYDTKDEAKARREELMELLKVYLFPMM